MTITHLGNNFYIGWKFSDDDISQVPQNDNAIYIEVDTGFISQFKFGAWTVALFGGKGDQLFASILKQMTMTNIGTTYKDVFPVLFDGFPIPIDTSGYKNLGIVVLWNKNSGTGRHDFRLINNANDTQVLVNTELLDTQNGGDPTTGGLKSGRTKNYNIDIPTAFENFRGELRIQAKSTVAADDPIFEGLLIYLIR
jgi:hypothetical protein